MKRLLAALRRGTHHCDMDAGSLFSQLLDGQWPTLAEPVRRMHGAAPRTVARGTAEVEGDLHLPARLLRRMCGLPAPGLRQPLEVVIERDGRGEVWTRRFARGRMRSRLYSGRDGSLHERLGPLLLRFRLGRSGDAVDWRLQSVRLFGVPLPRAWFGTVRSRSACIGGRYAFVVDARLPLIGRLVAYRGWLEIVDGG